MSTKQRDKNVRSTEIGTTDEGLTKIHQGHEVPARQVLAGEIINGSSERDLGPPCVGKPWPDEIEVEIAFSSDRDPSRTLRSFGFRGRASRRMVLALVLISTLIYAATSHNNGMITRFLKTVVKILK